ncbi:hypothetical protein ACSBQN_08450 [Morganella sp. B601]|uniref:hypothetical protein n=1 Tax=Morganella TaxID=581 RepID=UPI0034E39E33
MEKYDFLGYAKNLIKNDTSEVAIRVAISRSYYSCFYHSIDLIKPDYISSDEWKSLKFGDHKKLIHSLHHYSGCHGYVPKKLAAKVANKLNYLKTMRQDADYDLKSPQTVLQANQVINESDKLIELINSLEVSSEKAQA